MCHITVSQNDNGLAGFYDNGDGVAREMKWPENLLILSAGGYGHVPVPLFKQSESITNQKPVTSRGNFLSFVGSLRHCSVVSSIE